MLTTSFRRERGVVKKQLLCNYLLKFRSSWAVTIVFKWVLLWGQVGEIFLEHTNCHIRFSTPECFILIALYDQLLITCKKKWNFRSHRWGSSLQGLRRLDPPLGPPSIWAEISGKHTSAESPSNISPNLLEVISKGGGGSPVFFGVLNPHIFVTLGLMPSFETLGQLLKIPSFVRPNIE